MTNSIRVDTGLATPHSLSPPPSPDTEIPKMPALILYYPTNSPDRIPFNYTIDVESKRYTKYKKEALEALKKGIKEIEAKEEVKLPISDEEVDRLAGVIADLKKNKAKPGIYKREINSGVIDLPRTIEILPNKDIYIHFNRRYIDKEKKIGDPIIDEGGFKVVKYTVNITQSQIEARATPRKDAIAVDESYGSTSREEECCLAPSNLDAIEPNEEEVVRDADFHKEHLSDIDGVMHYRHQNTFKSKAIDPDTEEPKDSTELIMPLCEGTLASVKLNEEQKIQTIVTILQTMKELQSKNIILRDIKPDNILMKNGKPLIADFGCAVKLAENGPNIYPKRGSEGYIPPEAYKEDQDLTPTYDSYALGLTIMNVYFDGDESFDVEPQTERGKKIQSISKRLTDENPHTRMYASEALEELITQRVC